MPGLFILKKFRDSQFEIGEDIGILELQRRTQSGRKTKAILL
jgi:hypothetical protein